MRTFLLTCLPLLAAAATRRPLLGANQPCWDKTKELDALAANNGGVLPPGGERPTCDRLGRFSPKQCSGSQCYCVDPQGEQLEYTQNRWEADIMQCRCAREEHEIAEAGQLGSSVKCDVQGNYHHTQCRGSSCYCVHPATGEAREGTEAHVGEFSALEEKCSSL
ncbi:equistatin-like [Pollicipes pollicipes]|uniref:equistatin-like n=1 Tax=Pollicipes pollicipes TaxID=41117 RepID=UPI001884A717|nr:equistatin-like [Pollicipes pollicipes]